MARPRVRTVPPWVTLDDDDFDNSSTSEARLNSPVSSPLNAPEPTAQPRPGLTKRVSRDGYEEWVDERLLKTSKLPPWMRKRSDRPGRRWDHLRTNEPVIMGTGYRPPGVDPYAKWRDFMRDNPYPPVRGDYEIVPYDFLAEMPQGRDTIHDIQIPSNKPSKKQRFLGRLWSWALRHPLAQLIFRLLVLGATISSLAVSTSLYQRSPWRTSPNEAEKNQIIMAIIVDCIAIPYILYMTWDDFAGKPLGLRPPIQKITLTLLDLFFIILKSASTALAFQTLEIRTDAATQGLATTLASMLAVGLVSWVANFTISVLRIVERLGGVEEGPAKQRQ
ncbi:hypothetical protein JX266_005920 [Neoarthrinium moseri]|uniref:uncharacterized protein n=1 Tax=Neoarthrinium moseri TaxID=1658444 RepID=UPI001FDDB656|nr:uncharacterized protein JN550_002049 [Neoarthrinium moseri]KAI1848207.1 hypothetical protein JX266_005920 [Neoarthrinium moseri]KAI1875763.1 hypothetical protein JN550_002049 [Neoarthrinium moseri]